MSVRRLLCRVFWCLLPLLSWHVGAAEIRIQGDEAFVPLDAQVEMFADTSAAMDIEAVVAKARFAPNPQLLRPGVTASAIWLKVEIVNASSVPLTRWLSIQPARQREVRFFVRQQDRWLHFDAGSRQPFGLWPIPALHPVFPVQLLPQATHTVYLRVASPVPITIKPTLWEPTALRAAENHVRLIDGLMLGGLAVMFLLAILMVFLLRDRAFLFNALATATYCLGVASDKGYSFMYLWPNATDWVLRCMPLFALLGVGMNLLFVRELLATRRQFPKIDTLLWTLLAIQWLPALGILFGDIQRWAGISLALNLPATVVLLLVGLYAMSRGIQAARYYTAAYAVLTMGSLFHILALSGAISPAWYLDNALPVSMLLSNLLMLASVVDRIEIVHQQKEAAQSALLEIRAVHEAQLERAVEERTTDLHAALAESRQARQSQNQLVAYISHDLRAPLATIVHYVHLLEQQDGTDIERYKATIERSALHQLELIDDLVEYARGELHHLELVPIPTYLHDWLDNIARNAELLAAQQGNRFHLAADEALPPVVVFDPKRLRQVVMNLIANAAKFTCDGEIRLVLYAGPADAKVMLTFAVEDTGPGIQATDLAGIFLPFVRGSSERAGYGLGLGIARQLVSTMGGELKVESEPGQGSRFSFGLVVPTASEADVMVPTATFDFPEPFGAGKTLLVADDNPVSREHLREVLLAADFDVVCAEDGTEALRLACSRDFDGLLIDQCMPGMSGWDVLRKLNAARPGAVSPVILCSAMPPQRPVEYPKDIDFAATLLKPVDANRLLGLLKELQVQQNGQKLSVR